MKSFPTFARLTLMLALSLALVTPAPAQEASAEETVLYQTWFGANSANMAEKAAEAAKEYLTKFPKGQYAAYLNNWLMGPKLKAFDAALQAGKVDDLIKVGREILVDQPENLAVTYSLAFSLRRLEIAAATPSFAHAKEAVEFSQAAIKLIEAGKVIEGGRFNKNTSLAILYQIQALVAAKEGKTAEALALYGQSSAADPGNAGIQGYNLLALASLQRVPYDEAAKAYQALPEADRQAAAPTDAVKAALDAMYAAADPLIDSWARFVALSRARNIAAETRDQVLAGLKSVYTTRFAGDVSGLEPLITKLQADYTPKP